MIPVCRRKMVLNILNHLTETATRHGLVTDSMQFPDCILDPGSIKVVMINEAVPKNPDDWFYSKAEDAENRRTAFRLFEAAGLHVNSMDDVLGMGIYITAALKTPKEGYFADPAAIKAQLPLLESELELFPNLKAIMLMGDVAKKAFNLITKKKSNKNVIPSKSTYRIRQFEYYWNDIRVFPSYIMTGANLLIEKGKCDMITDDIRRMLKLLQV